MNYKKYFWILIIVTTLIRLFIIGQIGLGDDEAHYFAYSQFLDLSYFDHPPAIGYIIKFSTSIFGINEFAVRLPTVIFFFIMNVFIFLLAKKMFGEKIAFWSVVLLNVTPVFSFLGAVLTVPDSPLALSWIIFIFMFWEIIKNNKPQYWWYVLGFVLGVGLLSKYNAILLVPSALLFIIFSPRDRHWLKRKEPYIALFIAFIVFLPVVLWNIYNDWASFGYQLRHGFGSRAPNFSFDLLGRSLGAQAGYISPLLFVLNWFVLAILGWNSFQKRDENSLFLFSFSFPTLFIFNAISSFNEILPHWPAMGYLILVLAVAKFSVDKWHNLSFRIFTVFAWGLGIFLTLLVPIQALYKVLPPEKFMPAKEAYKIEDGIVKAEKVDITNELYGWKDVGEQISEIIKNYPEPKPFVFTHRHYIASQLKFYIPGSIDVYCLSNRIDAYDFWQRDLNEIDGRDGIFVTDNRFFTDPKGKYPFITWEKPKEITIYRSGRKIRKFWLTIGKEFSTGDLNELYTSKRVGPILTFKQGLISLDHLLFDLINKDKKAWYLDYPMRFFSLIGNGLPLLIVVGVVLWFTRRDRFWREFLLAAGIILLGGIIVQIIKNLIGRARPLTVFGDQIRVLGDKLYFASFPSGHTQASFSAATFLTWRIKNYWWLFFIFAVLVGISRIYIGVHFPFDVFTGAAIGVVITVAVLKFLQIKKISFYHQ